MYLNEEQGKSKHIILAIEAIIILDARHLGHSNIACGHLRSILSCHSQSIDVQWRTHSPALLLIQGTSISLQIEVGFVWTIISYDFIKTLIQGNVKKLNHKSLAIRNTIQITLS